jgi:sugar (pentulose or hexulose) kinase
MRRPAHSVGIAFSTSSVTIAALDKERNVLAVESSAISAGRCPPPAVRQRPADWIDALREAFARLKNRCDLSKLAAFSVAGTAGTILATAGDGTSVGDALMADDASGARYSTCIAAAAPSSDLRGTTSALARALWIWSARHPVHLVHQTDWIAGQLSGRIALSDTDNAVVTGYDPAVDAWPDWFDRLSPALRRCLPEVIPVGEHMGTAATPFARSLGLPASALCTAGCTEGAALDFAANLAGGGTLTSREPAVGMALLAARAVAG